MIPQRTVPAALSPGLLGVISSALCGALLSVLASAPAAAQTIETLLQQGDLVPGVGLVTRIDNLAVNSNGDWLVEARTDHPDPDADSVVLKNGVLLFREGQALNMPPGASINFFDDLWINIHGDVSNNFFLSGTAGSFDDSGVYWNDVLVLQESDVSTSPAFTPGTPYIGFFGTKINALNQILVMASVNDVNIPSSVNRALVVLDVDGSGSLISETVFAKEGDVLPGVAPEAVTDFRTGPHDWAFSDLGDLMFVALLTGPTATNNAIYINNTLIARKGDPTPVPGFNWSGFTTTKLDLSSNGQHYAFKGSVDGPTATNLMIVRNGAKLVQKGDSLPAIAPFVFTTFGSGPVDVSDSGDVLWYGDWDDPDTTKDKALFLNDQILVQIGVTTVGGVTVQTLRGIQDGYRLSRDGRYVIFEAVLSNGVEGAFLLDRMPVPPGFCSGDGSGAFCPCGNTGGAGEGCANSTQAGAVLAASGSASIAAGDLVLSGSQLVPGAPGLYFQGDMALNGGLGVAFGDGLRCVGINVVRVQVVTSSGSGNSQTSVNVAAVGGVSAGELKHYQLWYRDPVGSPCGSSFNLTNALEVDWLP